MTWVKLCGLRTEQDVAVAVEVGADAIGLVTAPRSVRVLTPEAASAISAGAPVARYLVTEDLEPAELLAQAEAAGVTGVQPHGAHAAAAAAAAAEEGYEILFPVASRGVAALPPGYLAMIDGPRPGSGAAADWEPLLQIERRFVLAGGLDPGNVAEAIHLTGAYGVDVSSGIESTPGVKDHELMRRFVAAVR